MRKEISRYVRFVLPPALALVYVAAFPAMYPFTSEAAGALMVVPISLAAWQFGARGAYSMAVVMCLANTLVFTLYVNPFTISMVESAVAASIFGGVGSVIVRLRDANRKIADLTYVDQLTGLPNGKAFLRHLDGALRTSGATHVGLVEIASLREVKESFGDQVGDELVLEIGRRLVAALVRNYIARSGTATFAIAITSAIGSDDWLAKRALEVFRAPFLVSGGTLVIEGRVGMARAPEHGTSVDEVFQAAEAALFVARRSSTNWATAVSGRGEEAGSRLQTIAALRSALGAGELSLNYQPLLNITDGKVRGFEALLRWRHNGKQISPADFIPLAEQSGLIVPLTEWVVKAAVAQLAQWNAAGTRTRVAVNVGAKNITAAANLPGIIQRLLLEYGVDASQLGIEVTETDIMTDPKQAIESLRSLKQLGLSIAIDDFGTGYSSLFYLQELPLDEVKIDRSFIQRLARDASTSAIVRAAVDLSHALGLDTLAEGVEDQATLDRLTVIGCDYAQGYLIAKPMPADQVLSWLTSFTPQPASVTAPVRAVGPETSAHVDDMSTVLVVDDEHSLRVATHRMLAARGYRVLHAATASEALRIFSEEGDAIDLVVTDIFLTDWRGHELAQRLLSSYPDTKFLYVSGDPKANELVGQGRFLAKPFSKQQLIDNVEAVLAA